MSASIIVNYRKTFLKGKQEVSGYFPEATDQESKETYIMDYETNQGILLDADRIKPNPAMTQQQVSKLCLNSFWGENISFQKKLPVMFDKRRLLSTDHQLLFGY